jgi:hypothetical protein
MQITTIDLDIAKNVFQVHGIDARKRLSSESNSGAARSYDSLRSSRRALLGLEACATSPYWVRELAKLGHEASAPLRSQARRDDYQLAAHRDPPKHVRGGAILYHKGLDFCCERSVSVGHLRRTASPVWDLAPLAMSPLRGFGGDGS